MNAQEQIAMLRRALEAVHDWYGGKLTVCEFHDKWCPQGMSAGEFTSRTYNEAMLATATPPMDDILSDREELRRIGKERDDALAKLAEKEKELAAVCQWTAAKPNPSREFDVTFPTGADGVEIPTVVRLSIKTELVSEKLAECASEEVARRIADLLNAGGAK